MAYVISQDVIELMNNSLTNPASVNIGCIGELVKLKLTIDASGGETFTSKQLWWNTALFKPVNTPTFDPTTNLQGWYFDTTGKATGATYVKDLSTNGGEDGVNNSKLVTINYISATQIILENNFYLVYDLHDFIKNGVQDNLAKFRRNSINSNTDFENLITSVYNTDRGLWSWFHVEASGVPGGGTGGVIEICEVFTPQATVADNDLASATTLVNTPAQFTAIRVYSNGMHLVGDGTKVGVPCYFSGDGGVTARGTASLSGNGQAQAGDELYWNGSVAGHEIQTTYQMIVCFIK